MSRNSLLPFTSTRCTASATVSSLSDPHDASGFQKAACGKKGKKYQVEYPCQLLPRVLQAHYQSPRSRLPEFKMVNISVQKASPFTGLLHPFQFKRHHISVQNSSMLMWQLLLYFSVQHINSQIQSSTLMWQLLLYLSVWHINNHIEIFLWSHKSCI